MTTTTGTDEVLGELELREYADRMAEAERIVRFGVWRWEIETGRVRWSDELHRIYGLAPGEFEGTVDAFVSFLHPDDRERVWSNIERALERVEPFVFEERIVRADGKLRVLLSQGRPVVEADGHPSALVGVCQDVTDRHDAQRALGLGERRMRAIIDHSPSVIAVKDLDGRYLMTNAEMGRLLDTPADQLIGRECAELFPTIAEQLWANDRLAAAEMEPVYDEAVLELEGEARTFLIVTFALPDDAGRPVETCTIATDVTERKQRDSERRRQREWEQRIESALSEGRMTVFAQPVIDLSTEQQEWHELLVRMRPPGSRNGLLAPASFLPAAERFGLIQSIDIWMVGRALELAAVLAPVVNISAVTLCDAAARQEILGLLEATPDRARGIVFEITETAAADHLNAAQEFASALTGLGCGLALDDFGTGFGSFTYLRSLPLRYLKIDASFVTDVESSRDDRRVVQSIIGIAAQFDLLTIAEGVEKASTVGLLRELGADYAQGYHLGRPIAVPETP
jgi:PAS domain S-box-containing protein